MRPCRRSDRLSRRLEREESPEAMLTRRLRRGRRGAVVLLLSHAHTPELEASTPSPKCACLTGTDPSAGLRRGRRRRSGPKLGRRSRDTIGLSRDAATGRAERHPHARPRGHLVACAPRAATRGSRAPSRVRANRTSRANTQPLIKKLTTTTSAADRPGTTAQRHRRGGAPTRKRSGVRMRMQSRLRGRQRPRVSFREEKRKYRPRWVFFCGNTIFF